MRLVVTTIVREAPIAHHGFVYVVDWDKKKLIHRFQPPPPRLKKLGPRGGSRGFRGITFVGDLCYVANHDSIFAYDSDWRLVNTISHPQFADIHEIEAVGDSIWVTSAGIDAVLKVTSSGEIVEGHYLGELAPEARSELGIGGRQVDHGADCREQLSEIGSHVAHPNGLCLSGGRVYVTLYSPGAIISFDPLDLIWRDDRMYGVHSGRIAQGGRLLYVAASFQSEFQGIDLPTGEPAFRVSPLGDRRDERALLGPIRDLLHRPIFWHLPTTFLLKRSPSVVRKLLPSARPGWTRGIAVLDEDYILGGSSPATISLINTRSGSIEGQFQLEKEIRHSVFAIAVDPR